MKISTTTDALLQPGLARIYFKECIWPKIKTSLGYKRIARKVFEKYFKMWIRTFQGEGDNE